MTRDVSVAMSLSFQRPLFTANRMIIFLIEDNYKFKLRLTILGRARGVA
jgi:hypothetical protein